MTHRTFDEQIANFNRVVSSWDINQEYKVALLGMIASLGYEHEKSITPEPHWIPVADGLPNIREDVLVSYYDEVMVGWLNDDGTWFAEGFGRLNMNDIAAWRLLPEPYKEVTT